MHFLKHNDDDGDDDDTDVDIKPRTSIKNNCRSSGLYAANDLTNFATSSMMKILQLQ